MKKNVKEMQSAGQIWDKRAGTSVYDDRVEKRKKKEGEVTTEKCIERSQVESMETY